MLRQEDNSSNKDQQQQQLNTLLPSLSINQQQKEKENLTRHHQNNLQELDGVFNRDESTGGLLDTDNRQVSVGEAQTSDSGSRSRSNKSRVYMYLAGVGSVLMALSSMIRGIESGTPLPTKFSVSVSYLVLSLMALSYKKCTMGEQFKYPWLKKQKVAGLVEEQYLFDWAQFTAIIVGGVGEFVCSIAVIMSFSAALSANINQGIGANIMIFNAVIVTILSYCLLGEIVSRCQVFGIFIVVAAVALVSLFGPEQEISQSVGQIQQHSDSGKAMFQVVIWGIVGAVFISFEIMCNKWLMIKRGVNGDVSGMFFLFVEGLIGSICLIVTTAQGEGLYEMDLAGFLLVLIAGLFAFTGLMLLNYSIATGLAGVAISIFNTNPSIQCIFSSIFLRQVISNGQIAGVILSLVGACVLTIGDMLIEKCCKNSKKEVQITTNQQSEKYQQNNVED